MVWLGTQNSGPHKGVVDECLALYKRHGEASGECAQIGGVVSVYSGAVSKPFEGGNVLVNLSFLHLQVLHLILGSFMFRIVGKHVLEFVFHVRPGCASYEKMRVVMNSIEPFIHLFRPSFDFWSFNQG
jgi:hypothetical protein